MTRSCATRAAATPAFGTYRHAPIVTNAIQARIGVMDLQGQGRETTDQNLIYVRNKAFRLLFVAMYRKGSGIFID